MSEVIDGVLHGCITWLLAPEDIDALRKAPG